LLKQVSLFIAAKPGFIDRILNFSAGAVKIFGFVNAVNRTVGHRGIIIAESDRASAIAGI